MPHKCDTKTEINTHTHTHTHTHKHKPPDNMDSGKEDKAISLKEEGKFVKECVLHRDLGGHGMGHVGMEEEFARPSQKKKRKAEEEEEEKADLLSSCDTSFASTLSGNWPTPDKEDCVESGSPKGLGRCSPPGWIPGYGKTREEEKADLLSSCDTSFASTLVGNWPNRVETPDKEDCVESGSPKGLRRWVPPEWIPGYGKTWMDQNPSPYESHGTGEEDEVVEGEDNDIDDADNESEHPDVLMDSGKKSDEKEDLEELKRSLDETERQLNAQLMTLLRNNHVDTDKMLFMTRDDNNEQWRVSNGIRWRKHNKVWDPDPIF